MSIKAKIRGLFRNSLASLKINATLHRLRYFQTLKTMERRSVTDIFDYKTISRTVDDLYVDYIPENNFYGMSFIIKRFIGRESKYLQINGFFEHGLFFGKYIAKQSYKYGFDRIFTFGQFRYEVLMNNPLTNNKTIIELGPYIAYAKSLLSEEKMNEIKKELGKTLLVFPSHSAKGVTTQFDNDELVDEIERIKESFGFKTIIVSLYYRDIDENLEYVRHYETKGYRIVCSGSRGDIHFLDRQRTIIELSDVTMSNEAGTHIGYCIYLNKPHYVYSQSISFKENYEDVLKQEGMSDEISKSQVEHRFLVESLFNEYTEVITDKQKEIVDYYWGVSRIKSVSELKELFK